MTHHTFLRFIYTGIRQLDHESCALPWFTFCSDAPSVRLHQLAGAGQPQSAAGQQDKKTGDNEEKWSCWGEILDSRV